jgi:hypothetical protein
MHTLQIMLVEADSKEEAVSEVLSRTGYYDEGSNGPDWSDWHAVGGRWDGFFDGENVLCYAENVELAEESIKNSLMWRKEEVERLKTSANLDTLEVVIDNYDPENPTFDHSVWATKRLAEIVLDYWTPDSKVYDLESYTASLKYYRERLQASPEKQFLVAVDFHF